MTAARATEAQRGSKGEATRERILVEAARLFAVRGYFGTSTRDIAEAVGVRQPTLFFHFPTKQAIVEVLLEYSLAEPIRVATMLGRQPVGALVQIYGYVWFDTGHLLRSPYDLTGVHGDDLMSDEAFAPWSAQDHRLRRLIRRMVRRGQEEGSLRRVDPRLTQELISGINLNTIRMAHSSGGSDDRHIPDFVADFTLRAIAREPLEMSGVRERALTLVLA